MIFSKKAKIFGKFVTVFVMISMLASVFGGFELIPAYASEDTGLAAAVEKLVIKNIDSPENGITLDTVVGDGLGSDKKGSETHGYDVSWSSNYTSVITNTGVVYPSTEEAKTVTMTATVTSRATGGSQDKTFTVNVPKVQPYKINNVYITGADGIRDTLLVGGKTVSEVSLTRYAASGEGAAVVILGLYDGDVLVKAVTNELKEDTMDPFTDKNVTLSNTLTLPATIENTHSLKVFVFNSKSNVSPLAKMTVYGKDTANSAKIYIIGDSTVQSYNKTEANIAQYNPQNGWGAYISENFDLTVNNYAVGGTSTRSYLETNRYKSNLPNMKAGDFLLIQFGGNDMKDDYLNEHTTVNLNADKTDFDYTMSNTFASYLQMYVDFARSKGATPVFVSSPSRASLESDGRGDYPTAMRLFAAKKGLPYVNLTNATAELYKQVPNYYNNYFLTWGQVDAGEYGHTVATMVEKFGPFGSDYADKASNKDITHFNIDGAKMAAHLVSAGIVENNLPIKRYNTTSLTTVEAAVAAEVANPPIPPVVEEPALAITNLTATSKANGVSLAWDTLDGATSYDVYRDDSIVATVETNSFNDKYFSTLENYLDETTNGIATGLTGGTTGTITTEHTYKVVSDNNGESTEITAKASPEKLVWFSVPEVDDYSGYGKSNLAVHGTTSNNLKIGSPGNANPYRVLTQLDTPVGLKGSYESKGTTLYEYSGTLTSGEYFYIGPYKSKSAVGYVITNTKDDTSVHTNQIKFAYDGDENSSDGLNPTGYEKDKTENYIVLLNAALEDSVKQYNTKAWNVFGTSSVTGVSVVPDVKGIEIDAQIQSTTYYKPSGLAGLTDEQSWATYILEFTTTKKGTSDDNGFYITRHSVSTSNYADYYNTETGRYFGYHSVTVLKASDYIKD